MKFVAHGGGISIIYHNQQWPEYEKFLECLISTYKLQ